MAIAGLNLIVPSSATATGGTVSVSATGTVTLSNTPSVSINDCFSSTYDNYVMVFRLVTDTDRVGNVRLRASGTDASGSNYNHQYLYVDGGTRGAARVTGATSGEFYAIGAQPQIVVMYLSSPAIAEPTFMKSIGVDSGSAGLPYFIDRGIQHTLSTAYDGITFYLGASSLSGQVCVYGIGK